jgi:hypothetical protein
MGQAGLPIQEFIISSQFSRLQLIDTLLDHLVVSRDAFFDLRTNKTLTNPMRRQEAHDLDGITLTLFSQHEDPI